MQDKNHFLEEATFAISSPIRIEILKLVKTKGNVSNKELSAELNIHPANISQHLKILKHSNLIEERERLKNNTILLSIVPGSLKKLKQGLDFLFV